ncbi:MAG: 3-methyl-2-oxobutanoate hydroxymethyltransferase [Opitutae bacterium]|nr:3-methyl-2-oxobutanoate hydroxymethyltransferase [Opitutae bacterium]
MPSIREFATAKSAGRKLVVVTSYDAWSARLLAETPVDCLLVGDSAMMVVHGERDTLGATTELMVLHTRAVAKGAPDKLIVADMPFLAARKGSAHALDCAAALLRAGAHAVKIEGARGHLDVIGHLVESGIPVMGHLGLTPQSVHAFGGFKVQARETAAATQLREDAAALEAVGAFAIVLECIPAKLAGAVTADLRIPTIGIGAGADCDGQVLVLHDLLGFNPDFKPRFVRRFADGAATVQEGVKRYAAAVQKGEFPQAKESF